jgi:hypothetical protein
VSGRTLGLGASADRSKWRVAWPNLLQPAADRVSRKLPKYSLGNPCWGFEVWLPLMNSSSPNNLISSPLGTPKNEIPTNTRRDRLLCPSFCQRGTYILSEVTPRTYEGIYIIYGIDETDVEINAPKINAESFF